MIAITFVSFSQTFVIMANQITSQREQLFEDPEKYRPERWLSQSEYAHNPYHEYSCLPFGYGARSCLGRNMAETQMMLLAAKVKVSSEATSG